jgi:sulfatase modifying factor 1
MNKKTERVIFPFFLYIYRVKNLVLFVIGILFLVEVIAQPKTLYGLKTSKFIPATGILTESFYMDETPVTYNDFKIYVRAGGEKTAYWFYESYNINEQPVTGISWHHAADYCNWRSKCEGLKPVYFVTDSLDEYGYRIYEKDSFANGYRLPTADEFKYAAFDSVYCKITTQGNYLYKYYPWGINFYGSLLNDDFRSNIDIDSGMKSTKWWRLAPVKSQFRNSFGLYNVCGNNWHWSDDWKLKSQGKKWIIGGGWGVIDTMHVKIGYVSWCSPGNYNYDIGFRCVKNISGITDSIIKFDTTIQYDFYKPLSSQIKNEITDFFGEEFKNRLAKFIGDSYPECINFHMKVDEQEILNPESMAELIIKVCKRNNIHPLFLTTIMISESGFGSVSFPRWYNNPMAYMWQNKLMEKGEPVYENMPGKRNRKYKTLEEGFEAFCKGIRRDLYYKAAKKNLDSFHLIYVGYRADEWMNTMTRIYHDIAGVRFEPKFPEGDAGKFIYTDW